MHDEDIDRAASAWLDAVEARWRRTGIAGTTCARLRSELEADLSDALYSGAARDDLLAAEPYEFADQLARAHGLLGDGPVAGSARPTPAAFATTALLGALAGAAAVWFVVWPVLNQATSTVSDDTSVALFYSVGAVVVLLGAAIAVRRRFRAYAGVRDVVGSLAGLVAGSLAGLAPTLAISRALAYPSQPLLVLIEALPVLALAAAGILLARRFAARRAEAVAWL